MRYAHSEYNSITISHTNIHIYTADTLVRIFIELKIRESLPVYEIIFYLRRRVWLKRLCDTAKMCTL